MGQDQANQDKTSGESANDHFHKLFSCLNKTDRYKNSEGHAVEGAANGMGRQWATACRTADQFVPGKPKSAADQGAYNDS